MVSESKRKRMKRILDLTERVNKMTVKKENVKISEVNAWS